MGGISAISRFISSAAEGKVNGFVYFVGLKTCIKFLLCKGVSLLTVNTPHPAKCSWLYTACMHFLYNVACDVNATLGACQTPVSLYFLFSFEQAYTPRSFP